MDKNHFSSYKIRVGSIFEYWGLHSGHMQVLVITEDKIAVNDNVGAVFWISKMDFNNLPISIIEY